MREIALVAIKSVYHNVDPNRRDNTFEVKWVNLDIWTRLYDRWTI